MKWRSGDKMTNYTFVIANVFSTTLCNLHALILTAICEM